MDRGRNDPAQQPGPPRQLWSPRNESAGRVCCSGWFGATTHRGLDQPDPRQRVGRVRGLTKFGDAREADLYKAGRERLPSGLWTFSYRFAHLALSVSRERRLAVGVKDAAGRAATGRLRLPRVPTAQSAFRPPTRRRDPRTAGPVVPTPASRCSAPRRSAGGRRPLARRRSPE